MSDSQNRRRRSVPVLSINLRGIIFDLDGTLVDSHLDFDAIRRELDLPAATPILEALDRMPDEQADRCLAVLHRYETEAAERATLQEGAAEFLQSLDKYGIRRAVVTRNRGDAARRTLQRLGLVFEIVIAREDGPVKPDPWAIRHICESWNVQPQDTLVIGDFHFDIEAGRQAGANTMLITHGRDTANLKGSSEPDHIAASFADATRILERLSS